ncbi:MAG: dienelactone hydrolase family protein [Noviherbaspirillum sp.]
MQSAADDVQAVRMEPNGLEGLMGLCAAPKGMVVFAHGSGSGRFSPRNNRVAAGLRRAGFATLLLDLLRPEEEAVRGNVFDIPLLAGRLIDATRWIRQQPQTASLPVGFFGASTGAGAALAAAARAGDEIAAIVSRGGRPDLAGPSLSQVRAPTLLIVGSLDTQVIALNRQALAQLSAQKELAIVPGASHLFEEPGTLDQVLDLAIAWFTKYLGLALT